METTEVADANDGSSDVGEWEKHLVRCRQSLQADPLAGIPDPTKLRHINVAFNSIRDLQFLSACSNLEHLNIAHNRLASLESMPHLPRLRVLNCCNNSIPSGRGLANCPGLEELWLASNSLASFADVAPLADAGSLTAVVLHQNPVLRSARSAAAIRRYLIHSLPQLRQADARPITSAERERASRFFQTTEGMRLLADMVRHTGEGGRATPVSRASTSRSASPLRSRTQGGLSRTGAPPVRTIARRRRRAASHASAALPPPSPAHSPAPAPVDDATSIADALAMLPGGSRSGGGRGAPASALPTAAGAGAELEISYPPQPGGGRLRPVGHAVRVSGGEASLWWPSGKLAASTSKSGHAVALYAHHRDGSLAMALDASGVGIANYATGAVAITWSGNGAGSVMTPKGATAMTWGPGGEGIRVEDAVVSAANSIKVPPSHGPSRSCFVHLGKGLAVELSVGPGPLPEQLHFSAGGIKHVVSRAHNAGIRVGDDYAAPFERARPRRATAPAGGAAADGNGDEKDEEDEHEAEEQVPCPTGVSPAASRSGDTAPDLSGAVAAASSAMALARDLLNRDVAEF